MHLSLELGSDILFCLGHVLLWKCIIPHNPFGQSEPKDALFERNLIPLSLPESQTTMEDT